MSNYAAQDDYSTYYFLDRNYPLPAPPRFDRHDTSNYQPAVEQWHEPLEPTSRGWVDYDQSSPGNHRDASYNHWSSERGRERSSGSEAYPRREEISPTDLANQEERKARQDSKSSRHSSRYKHSSSRHGIDGRNERESSRTKTTSREEGRRRGGASAGGSSNEDLSKPVVYASLGAEVRGKRAMLQTVKDSQSRGSDRSPSSKRQCNRLPHQDSSPPSRRQLSPSPYSPPSSPYARYLI